MTNRIIGSIPTQIPRMLAASGTTHLREEARPSATVETQVLFGEEVGVHGRFGEWLDCSVEFSGFTHRGFIHNTQLANAVRPPTHYVCAPWALMRSTPKQDAVAIDRLSMGSRIAVTDEAGMHMKVWPHGWVHRSHVLPLDSHWPVPFVEGIRSMVGTPFEWGGRSIFGLDCSGLIQLNLGIRGIASPRASSDMADHLGEQVPTGTSPQPGDFLFYSHHCAVYVGDGYVVHSNAAAGQVVCESLEDFRMTMVEVRGYSEGPHRRVALPVPA